MAFGGFLPPAAIEKLVRAPEIHCLEGETRTVTYLVCGLSGLGARTAEHRGDPKGFLREMNAVLAPLLEQVMAHGGIIDRLTPDGFAAFWNAPLEDPGHALHACEAAERLAAMAAPLNAELALARAPDGKAIAALEIHLGIATGEVIAGGLGASGRLGYGVHGEAVALAARLQALSSQYGSAVIVSEETRRAAEQAFAFLEIDCIAAALELTASIRLLCPGRPCPRIAEIPRPEHLSRTYFQCVARPAMDQGTRIDRPVPQIVRRQPDAVRTLSGAHQVS